jgi:hypothetical protein
MAGLPELQETGAKKMTEGVIEGAEEELIPHPSLKTAAKGAAAAAAIGAAAAVAKEIADRVGGNDGNSRGD